MKHKIQKSQARRKAELVYELRYFMKTLPYHFLVMGSVFIVSLIFNKWLEAVCFLTSFFCLRYKFDTTFHCDSIVWCMVFTNGIFALSIVLCPPIYMYLLSSMIFAYIDCLLLWLIQDRKEKKELCVALASMNKELASEIEKCKDPKAELIARCRNCGLNDRDTKLAIMYYYEHKTPKDIWLWYCEQKEYEVVEWNTIYQILWRIGKKLNKK